MRVRLRAGVRVRVRVKVRVRVRVRVRIAHEHVSVVLPQQTVERAAVMQRSIQRAVAHRLSKARLKRDSSRPAWGPAC